MNLLFNKYLYRLNNSIQNTFILFISIVTFIYFSSCSKNNKDVFSCDPGINDFVHQNIYRLGGINRADLASYSTLDSQIAIFRALSNDRKISIYTEKINLIMNSDSLTSAEKNHLQSMIDFMKPEYFDENYNHVVDSFEVQWQNYARTQFNWDNKKIFLYSQTWLTETEIMNLARPNIPPNTTPNCNCLSDWACSLATQECNKGVSCNISGGCGFWGTMKCKGRCNIGGNPA